MALIGLVSLNPLIVYGRLIRSEIISNSNITKDENDPRPECLWFSRDRVFEAPINKNIRVEFEGNSL